MFVLEKEKGKRERGRGRERKKERILKMHYISVYSYIINFIIYIMLFCGYQFSVISES